MKWIWFSSICPKGVIGRMGRIFTDLYLGTGGTGVSYKYGSFSSCRHFYTVHLPELFYSLETESVTSSFRKTELRMS